jgi:hypothetical protein
MGTIFDPEQAPGLQTNLVDNGGFEVWQRGTTFSSPASNVFTADRWKMLENGAPTFTITQESTTIDSGVFSLKLNTTAVGGATQLAIRQVLENGQSYTGRPLSFSCRVKCSAIGICTIAIADDNGPTVSTANVSTNWETLTVKLINTTVSSTLNVYVGFIPGGTLPTVSTIFIDSAMLVYGTNPATFVPTIPELDLARCQRFYEAGLEEMQLPIRHITTANVIIYSRGYLVQKSTAPTIAYAVSAATLEHLPTTGTGSSADTANWTASDAGGSTTAVRRVQMTRSTDQTTFPLLGFVVTWTASADI